MLPNIEKIPISREKSTDFLGIFSLAFESLSLQKNMKLANEYKFRKKISNLSKFLVETTFKICSKNCFLIELMNLIFYLILI